MLCVGVGGGNKQLRRVRRERATHRREELDEDVGLGVHHDGIEVGVGELDNGGGLLLDAARQASLAVDKVDDVSGSATAAVVLRGLGRGGEPLDGREAAHTEAAAEVAVRVGVHLGDDDAVIGLVSGADHVVLGGKLLAVAAPLR